MKAKEIIELYTKRGREVLPHFMEVEVGKEIAEISFKAGYRQRKDEELPYYKEERLIGIKEVVEFTSPLMGKISNIIADIRGDWTDPRQNCRDARQLIAEWQAKLKDWGVV
mgnify:CR=1 FL=1